MDSQTPPTISSFVIRFVLDSTSDSYRGEIRHIQTREEIHFNAWEEAVEFIRRYVPIEVESDK
jgi:Mn-containing catalase